MALQRLLFALTSRMRESPLANVVRCKTPGSPRQTRNRSPPPRPFVKMGNEANAEAEIAKVVFSLNSPWPKRSYSSRSVESSR